MSDEHVSEVHINTDPSIAVIAERVGNLVKAFDDHRKEYKIETESNRLALKRVQSSLDMAKGGYYVLAAAAAIGIYITNAWTKIVAIFH